VSVNGFSDFDFYCSELLQVTLAKHVPTERPVEKDLRTVICH
jgi:hypothetical protein